MKRIVLTKCGIGLVKEEFSKLLVLGLPIGDCFWLCLGPHWGIDQDVPRRLGLLDASVDCRQSLCIWPIEYMHLRRHRLMRKDVNANRNHVASHVDKSWMRKLASRA